MGKETEEVVIKAPSIGYIDLLDVALVENHKENPWQSTPIRPSAAGKCETALAYDYMAFTGKMPNVPEDRPPNVIRLLSLGHSVEFSMMQNLRLLKDKFDIKMTHKQHTVDCAKIKDPVTGEDIWIQGSTDFCLESESHGFKTICDAKSMKDAFSRTHKTRFDEELDKYSNMKTLEKLSDTCFYAEDILAFIRELGPNFKIMNISQLNYYACSDFFKRRGFDNCSLLYYNKNDSRMFELRFKPNQELADKVTRKFQNAINSTDPQKDTTKTYQIGSIICAFCPYKDKCWNDNALKAYFATYPPKKWPTDITKLGKRKKEVSELFSEFLQHDVKKKETIESRICKLLNEEQVRKIKLDNGRVFEVKLLKTKGPVLRETKL